VQGRLKTTTYEDREHVKHTIIEIVATTVSFLRLKSRPAGDATDPEIVDEAPDGPTPDDDDIPF
jgi:single-stranded DNA-binding protein